MNPPNRSLPLCVSVINWRKAHFEETLMGFSLLEKKRATAGVMSEGDTTDTSEEAWQSSFREREKAKFMTRPQF